MTDIEDRQARAEAINRALDELDAEDRVLDAREDAHVVEVAEKVTRRGGPHQA